MGLCAFLGFDNFWETNLFHPAAYLIVWLLSALALQFMSWTALLLGFLFLLAGGASVLKRWKQLAWRAKWLLTTLWLVLAYGTPGDLWQGLAWAPSLEGIDAASLHVVRLLLLLGTLAWLFGRLPHQQFIVSLWVLVSPFRRLGMDSERTVARLALVFDYLEQAPPKGSWRHFLDAEVEGTRLLETLKLEIPYWKRVDIFFLTGALVSLMLLVILP